MLIIKRRDDYKQTYTFNIQLYTKLNTLATIRIETAKFTTFMRLDLQATNIVIICNSLSQTEERRTNFRSDL